MKKITILSLFMTLLSLTNWGQCTASYNVMANSNGYVVVENTSTLDAVINFGDGQSYSVAQSDSTGHQYASNGAYTICVSIVDSSQNPVCSDNYCDSIVISGISAPCNITANYSWFQAYDSTSATWMNTVYVVDHSTGSNLNYFWQFGDGSTSNQQYPSHQYANTGQYAICLTVSTDSSCTNVFCDSIDVQTKTSGFTLNVISEAAMSIEEENNSIQIDNIYPNPTSDNAAVTITSVENTNISVRIIDLSGKIISQEMVNISAGENTIQLHTTNLTRGMYFVSISNQDNINTNLRLIKK